MTMRTTHSISNSNNRDKLSKTRSGREVVPLWNSNMTTVTMNTIIVKRMKTRRDLRSKNKINHIIKPPIQNNKTMKKRNKAVT
jgi:hypothetical protein